MDSFSRCYKPPLSLNSSIYSLSCWQYLFRLATSHFSSFPNWTELQSKAIDKWEQNLELFHQLSTLGPGKPSNSMVAFRGGPKTDSWGVALIHKNATFCFRKEKRTGKPLQFHTKYEEEEEKEEGRSARLELNLSLCLCWVGCCFEELILTLQTLPPPQGLPGNQNLLSVSSPFI